MTDSTLSNEAIRAALDQNWKEAIRVNTLLLKENSSDIEALSRLAYAYMQTGQITQAKKTYQLVLDLDQYNQIALKNIRKLSTIKKKDLAKPSGAPISPILFLEEPGKTKVVDCIHVAPPTVLATLSAGQEIAIKAKNHCVELRSSDNVYLAALPDDLAFRLNKLLAGGNTFLAIVKSVDKKSLKVILRELMRGKRFANQPSFISQTSYVPFSRSAHQPQEAPDMTPTGEPGSEEETPNEE